MRLQLRLKAPHARRRCLGLRHAPVRLGAAPRGLLRLEPRERRAALRLRARVALAQRARVALAQRARLRHLSALALACRHRLRRRETRLQLSARRLAHAARVLLRVQVHCKRRLVLCPRRLAVAHHLAREQHHLRAAWGCIMRTWGCSLRAWGCSLNTWDCSLHTRGCSLYTWGCSRARGRRHLLLAACQLLVRRRQLGLEHPLGPLRRVRPLPLQVRLCRRAARHRGQLGTRARQPSRHVRPRRLRRRLGLRRRVLLLRAGRALRDE